MRPVTAITGSQAPATPYVLPLRALGVAAALLAMADAVLRLTYWGRRQRETFLVWFDTTVEG